MSEPVAKEPTMAQRADALVEHVTHQVKHNAPVSPFVVSELKVLADHVNGRSKPKVEAAPVTA